MNVSMFLEKSGIWGYPLIFLSIIAIFTIVERIIFLINMYYKVKNTNRKEIIEKIRHKKSLNFNNSKNLVENIFDEYFFGYNYLTFENIKIEFEKLWKEANKNFKIMEFAVKVAPLLGILGTISGIIKSFLGMGDFTMMKKSLVTSGISEALITTAAGLVIAIFVLFWIYILKWFKQKIFSPYENILSILEAVIKDSN
ncbi:MAG TPA: MotA/TolQ/ExbB proton channel family protein [Candidatus Mcinerneyibacterium sp.]|nr:MotA/TolQ/ExbB proton channel family protein [Candidatus Mcinerneyibacterium sp.]